MDHVHDTISDLPPKERQLVEVAELLRNAAKVPRSSAFPVMAHPLTQ
jgi:hypothetical protein